MSPQSFLPRRAAAALFCFAAILLIPTVAAGQQPRADDKRVFKVMTRNMDAGTDLNLVFAATDQASLLQAIADTMAEVEASGIPDRAARLADEIAAQKPDLIGLQEVTLWRTGPLSFEPAGASDVLYDQLALLLSELGKRNLKYSLVVAQTLADIEAPVPARNLNLRLADRDAILARSDLKQSELDLFNIQTHRFQVSLTVPLLGGITIPRSFESVDCKIRGKVFRFVNTHLETTIPGVPQTVLLQHAEAQEILDSLPGEVPAILLGDFNANAEPGPEHTGTVEQILAAGFLDVWSALNPGDPGYTWPLFGEDQLRGAGVVPNERIDLIFTRDLTPVSVRRLGFGFIGGQYASDHAGVVAEIQVGK